MRGLNYKEEMYKKAKQTIESEGYTLLDKEWVNAKTKLNMKCPKGHLVNTATWDDFNHGNRCPYCSNPPKKVILGTDEYEGNTIWDTDRWMCDLGISEEDAKKHTSKSDKKITVKCPDCGEIREIQISQIYYGHSISCKKCGDGFSYPEKLMYGVLKQLNVKFKTQLTKKDFNWCDKYRYDFYLEDYNIIIETHGRQHYEEGKRGRTLQEEQENDKIKKELASSNGINSYVEIDCRESDLDFIKNNILNSELNKIFDLSKIDWSKCVYYSSKSLIKEVCDYWNNKKEYETTKDLGKYFGLSRATTIKYIKKGVELKWCKYNPKEEMRKSAEKNSKNSPVIKNKKIKCITTNKIFNSIKEAGEYYGVERSNISTCCNGKRNFAGKLLDGTKLQWMYYEN